MKTLKLRFYPLNGDLELNDVISVLSKDLRNLVDSKTGNICLNSPESKQGVLELLDATQGVMEASLDVEYENKSTGKITNNNTSERISWNMSEEDINDPQKMAPYMLELRSIKATSKDNYKIYLENMEQIEKFK